MTSECQQGMELSYRVELVDQTLLFSAKFIQGRIKLLLWFQNVKPFLVIYLWIVSCVLVLAQHGWHFWEGLNSGFQLTYCFRGYVENYLFIYHNYIGSAVPQMRNTDWLLLLHAFILIAFSKNRFYIFTDEILVAPVVYNLTVFAHVYNP